LNADSTFVLTPQDLLNFQDLPIIRRGRSFVLHTNKGQRLIDCWRADGRALLGHSIPHLHNAIKNRMEHHCPPCMPHADMRQVLAWFRRQIPERVPFLVADRSGLSEALVLLGVSGDTSWADLRYTTPQHQGSLLTGKPVHSSSVYAVWQPFLPKPEVGILLPVLPYPSATGPFVLLADAQVADNLTEEKKARLYRLSLLTHPADLAGLMRILPLSAVLGVFGNPVQDSVMDVHESAVGVWNEENWSKTKADKWLRQGPYLYAKHDDDAYRQVFKVALAKGVLLNPRQSGASILPGTLTRGERALLSSVLAL